jgi:hypothetical protein|tara:strand:- start:260 stop:952 length:693 start_codon:yes stop_codon:yes gene_type:complete
MKLFIPLIIALITTACGGGDGSSSNAPSASTLSTCLSGERLAENCENTHDEVARELAAFNSSPDPDVARALAALGANFPQLKVTVPEEPKGHEDLFLLCTDATASHRWKFFRNKPNGQATVFDNEGYIYQGVTYIKTPEYIKYNTWPFTEKTIKYYQYERVWIDRVKSELWTTALMGHGKSNGTATCKISSLSVFIKMRDKVINEVKQANAEKRAKAAVKKDSIIKNQKF